MNEIHLLSSFKSEYVHVCVVLCECVCSLSIDLQSPYLSLEHEKSRQNRQEEKDEWR